MLMRMLLLAMSLILLTSCSILSPVKTEMIHEYRLDVKPNVKKGFPTSKTIAVSMPMANRYYQNKKMVYSIRPYELRAFAKNRWISSPMQMLQPLIIEALQNSQHYKAAAPSIGTGRFDFLLNIQVIDFYQDFCEKGSVFKLRIRAQMVNVADRRIISSKEFSVHKPAAWPNPYGGVLAANAATSELLGELVKWCNYLPNS